MELQARTGGALYISSPSSCWTQPGVRESGGHYVCVMFAGDHARVYNDSKVDRLDTAAGPEKALAAWLEYSGGSPKVLLYEKKMA